MEDLITEKSRKYTYGPGEEFGNEETALRHAEYKVRAMREVYTETGRLVSDEITHGFLGKDRGWFQVEIVFRK